MDPKDPFEVLVERVEALERQLLEHVLRPHLQTQAERYASLLAEAEEMVAEIPADSWLWAKVGRELYLNAGVTGDREHDHANYLRGIWNQAHKDDKPKTCQDSDQHE